MSNVYWNEYVGEFVKFLIENIWIYGGLGFGKVEGDDKGGWVFFFNFGIEVNEGVLKFVWVYGKIIVEDKSDIVCFFNVFYGCLFGVFLCIFNFKY